MVYPVSQRFLDTIAYPHRIVTTCTVTPYNSTPTTLRVVSGSVTADRSQRIRRTGSIIVEGATSDYLALAQPGTRIAIDHGFAWSGTDQELIPQIRAELTSAALTYGAGTIQISLADYWQRIAAADYVIPYTPSVNAARRVEIKNAVNTALPGLTIIDTASDNGVVGTAQAWTSRADMISAFATDGGMDVYFDGAGRLIVRDLPTINDNVDYLIKTGRGGTLEALTRTRPLDKLYNTVIVTPASGDINQAWTQVIAQITDTTDPRHPNRIGVRPYRYAAPTVLTDTDAATVAAQILSKITGTTETLSLNAISHPGLEPGDIVRALTPAETGADIVNHFLEQVSIDFQTGSMTANTRNNTDDFA